jgi:GAF domain-containing protein
VRNEKDHLGSGAQVIEQRAPTWLDAHDALGSAVKHLTALSPVFNWVGIYVLNGDTLELGPFIGAPTEHTRIKVGVGVCGTAVARNEDLNVPDVTASDNYLACSVETQSELVVLVRDRAGTVVGQIDIDSHSRNAFSPSLEAAVKQIAQDLGDFWPAPEAGSERS